MLFRSILHFSSINENNGYSYDNNTGKITFGTIGTYAITATSIWSAAPIETDGSNNTILGSIRLITGNDGMTYISSTAYDGNVWHSMASITIRISDTNDTVTLYACNPTTSSMYISPSIEILRIGG